MAAVCLSEKSNEGKKWLYTFFGGRDRNKKPYTNPLTNRWLLGGFSEWHISRVVFIHAQKALNNVGSSLYFNQSRLKKDITSILELDVYIQEVFDLREIFY